MSAYEKFEVSDICKNIFSEMILPFYNEQKKFLVDHKKYSNKINDLEIRITESVRAVKKS